MQFVLASLSGWFLLGYGASKIFGGKKEEVVFCYYYNMITLLLWCYYNMTTLLKCSQPYEICSFLLDYLWANTAKKAERKKKWSKIIIEGKLSCAPMKCQNMVEVTPWK